MCLENLTQETQLFKDTNVITAYKVLRIEEDHVMSFMFHEWKPGINISDREKITLTDQEKSDKRIRKGFHVFLSEKDAYEWADPSECDVSLCVVLHSRKVVVPVLCRKEHLVAQGILGYYIYPNAVFMQVELTQETWDKQIKEHIEAYEAAEALEGVKILNALNSFLESDQNPS